MHTKTAALPGPAKMSDTQAPESRRFAHHSFSWVVTALIALLTLVPGAPSWGQSEQMEELSNFPHAALDILRGKHKVHYDVWIADTPRREEQGLMFVHDLPATQGMLFPQNPPRVMRMWMKNTLIELDMIFVGNDNRISQITAHAVPESLDTIESGGPVAAVLEIRGGEAQRRGLQVGDLVSWNH